ncbi:MAG: class I SAM-dependent methyltransferase, partial [Phycisphaerales bacterium]|nr:class I SAM-dependent methyltransferase [Phycisphaerales bacterium]
MSTPATIRIEDDPAPALRAAAARLDLHDDADLVLGLVDDILELRTLDARRGTGVRVDFRPVDLRTGAGNLSTKQPLARAVGPRGRRVLDATAGLGGDAFLIACLGHHVVA